MASADPAPDVPATRSTVGFLDGGGEMGGCILDFDWSTHPLGPIEAWPVALRIAVGLCLHSSFPTSIYWGPELHLFYNDAWIPFDGDRHPQALGRPGAAVRHEVWDVVGPQIAAVLETGEGFFAADQHLPMVRNGAATQSYWTYSLSPIRDESGVIRGVISQGNDTTAKMLAQSSLQMSEERPQMALDASGNQLGWDAVARVRAVAALRAMNTSLAGEVADRTAERDRIWEVSQDLLGIAGPGAEWHNVNPAWTRVLGWQADEIVGRTSDWLLHPDDVEKTHAEVARLGAGGRTAGFENRLRTRDGDYRTLSWTAVPVDTLLYTTARDVTEKRRQQAALLAAEERTRLVLEAMDGVGVWTYDIAADRFYSDASFAALYGFGPAQLGEGASMAEVMARVHPEDAAKMEEARAVMRSGQGDGELEYRLLLPDGRVRWIMVRHHMLLDDSGRREKVIGVGVDVTRQRELEESLRQSQKMEAVGQLTGGLAHDFNNLLTAISGALEMLQMRLKQGRIDDLQRYIGAAQTASARAAALTHRLLAFSRRQPLDPKPVDANRLIAGMADLIRGTVGPGIGVEVIGGEGLWPTLVDPNQLENALLNLCINARDAMPDGGRLTIETANVWFDDRAAHERDLAPGPYVSLCVGDSGTGMPPAVIARAFDPFFTTKPMGQGTGLGLSMIYGFARQSGGQVRIRSVVGEGTSMYLYLPRHHAPAENAAVSGDARPPLRGGRGETVLVVEDEPAVRMLVTEILGDLGYAAIEAGDAAEALPVLRSEMRIDLLITDVGLPGMNGREVANVARAARPALPVLFITGFAENAVIGDGPLGPGMQLVTKPFSMEALASRIREMVAGG